MTIKKPIKKDVSYEKEKIIQRIIALYQRNQNNNEVIYADLLNEVSMLNTLYFLEEEN